MAWTKRQVIEGAMTEIGLAPHTYDLTAAEQLMAARRLATLIAEWSRLNILIPYPVPAERDGDDLDDDSGIPDDKLEAVQLNLACRLAPSLGKAVAMETKKAARSAYNALCIPASIPDRIIDRNAAPAGAGNQRGWRGSQPFLIDSTDSLDRDTGGAAQGYDD